MKVITKVVLDITTGEVIERECYDYDGPVMLCKGDSAPAPPQVTYTQSPEQRQMWQTFALPATERLATQMEGGAPAWEIPKAPSFVDMVPSAQGLWSSIEGPGVQSYALPDATMLQPTQEWWQGVDPGIKAGLWQPYQEAGERLFEDYGARGLAGNPSAGVSGAAMAGLGELYAQGARNVPLQAFELGRQGRQMQYGSELARNIGAAGQLRENAMARYGQLQQEAAMDREAAIQDYNQALQYNQLLNQQRMMPFGMLPSLAGGAYSTPVIQQMPAGGGGGFNIGGALGGAGTGAMIGSAMAPVGATGLAALGGPLGLGIMGASALAGGMGGK